MVEVELNYNADTTFIPRIRRSSIVEHNKTNFKHGMEYAIYTNDMVKGYIWDKTSGVTQDKGTDYRIEPTRTVKNSDGTFKCY